VPINAEPSAHATGFAAVEDGQNAIILSWTDASGADGYLIKASAVSYAAIAAPVDGTPESDATLVKNVAQGTEIVEFTAYLQYTYYFKNGLTSTALQTSILKQMALCRTQSRYECHNTS
jgi:hypothetical protein